MTAAARLRAKNARARRLRERAEALLATARESDHRQALKLLERAVALSCEVMAEAEALDPVLRLLVGRNLPRC